MGFLDSVLKVFVGDKSKQDVKAIMPLVEKVKSFEASLSNISHDDLRLKRPNLKQLLLKPVSLSLIHI